MSTKVARCPNCHAKLRVHQGFSQGRCPSCKAMLGLSGETSGRKAEQGRMKRHANPTRGLESHPTASQARGNASAEDYSEFHGVKVARIKRAQVNIEQPWWNLGIAQSVEYAPEHRSERGKYRWVHAFGDDGSKKRPSRTRLYASQDGRALLLLGSFKVDPERGVVG